MKRSFRFTAMAMAIAIAACISPRDGYGQSAIPFDSDRWSITSDRARKEERLGRKSLFLFGGTFAHLKDVEFEDGVIEVDVQASTPRAFFGVVFRFRSEDDHEVFYLRAHKSGLPDAAQYTPSLNGSHPWQLYSGPGFTATADIPRDRWLHVKIEVEGLRGRVYLDNSPEPLIVINDLKKGYGKGSVGLFASAMGAHFSGFKFTPSSNPTPIANRGERKAAPSPPGVLAKWELSDAFDTGEKTLEALPSADELKAMKWQPVEAEPPGMIVIDRYRRSLDTLPPFANDPSLRLKRARGPKAVYARATVHSDRDQVKKLSLGYSDEVTVFLNGAGLFTGKSAYRFRDPGFLGIMDVENDSVYLPLRKGANEIILAVSEYFGGWGFICRIDDATGVRLD